MANPTMEYVAEQIYDICGALEAMRWRVRVSAANQSMFQQPRTHKISQIDRG